MKTRMHTLATALSIFLTMTVALTPMALGATWNPASSLTKGEGPIEVPPTPLPPQAPSAINVVERGTTSISLSWSDRSVKEDGYDLQRSIPGTSGWAFHTTFGPGTGEMSFDDNSLEPDSLYCYRVRVFITDGPQSFSPQKCAYTRDGNSQDVWRAQITFTTADVKKDDSNTDDPVEVRLNSNPHVSFIVPSGNSTWVDYGRNDFEEGDEFTYDLNLDNVGELGDINNISISKTGSNGWCIEKLALLINGIEVYRENFGSTSSTCKWLDNDNGHSRQHVIPHAALRAHPSWSAYNEGFALGLLNLNGGIPKEEMESRIESMVGHLIRFEPVDWGHLHGRAVEVTKGCPMDDGDCQTIHVDLDLETKEVLEVDVDFDLNIQCIGNELHFDSANEDFSQDSHWLKIFLGFGLIKIVDEVIEDIAQEQWQAIHENFDVPFCPMLHVDDDGNVIFDELPTTLPGEELVKDVSTYSDSNEFYDPGKDTSSDSNSTWVYDDILQNHKALKDASRYSDPFRIPKSNWGPRATEPSTMRGVQPNVRR